MLSSVINNILDNLFNTHYFYVSYNSNIIFNLDFGVLLEQFILIYFCWFISTLIYRLFMGLIKK